MAEQEGIIRFAYDLQPAATEIAEEGIFSQLLGWRIIFKRLEMVGQAAAKYQGLAFGNLRARDPERPEEFLITASQSSDVDNFQQNQLVRAVTVSNGIYSCGPRARDTGGLLLNYLAKALS